MDFHRWDTHWAGDIAGWCRGAEFEPVPKLDGGE